MTKIQDIKKKLTALEHYLHSENRVAMSILRALRLPRVSCVLLCNIDYVASCTYFKVQSKTTAGKLLCKFIVVK